ncbi:MAG: VOC family protein [Chloroflexi bacterium]|nr:VOC family protein [Chloroflexota bacterium]
MRLAGICLITSDVTRLTRFYCDVFQMPSEGDGTHASFALCGAELAIYSLEGTEAMAPGSTVGLCPGAFTLNIEVSDVDSEHDRLLAMGVPLIKPPCTYAWGTRSAWFRDPDGNIVNLYCRPGKD